MVLKTVLVVALLAATLALSIACEAQNGCLVYAREYQAAIDASQGLSKYGVWNRIVRVTYAKDPNNGHAYLAYELRSGNVWAYDIIHGSVNLHTHSHNLGAIWLALYTTDPTICGAQFLD